MLCLFQLSKPYLSPRLIPNNHVSLCTIWKNCHYLSSENIQNSFTQRCLQTKAQILYQNKVTPSEINEYSIPFVERKITTNNSYNIVNDVITSNDVAALKEAEAGVLEPCKEDISDIGPFASPAFNLAAYVNKSFTLQQFVQMGVKLHSIERKIKVAEYILSLDFETHVKPYLRFLHDVGVPADEFGRFITKNPLIFQENLDDLQIRVNYLEAKRFTSDDISRIITRNPVWLNFSTVDIDKRLGFFQRTFILSGDDVRVLATKRPSIITYDLGKITVSHFAVKEEMGFNESETKTLLLKAPKLFDIQTKALKSRFDFVHNIMNISHEQILQQPSILLFRDFIIRQRHDFLKELGKAQYDPKLPNYVSLETLVDGSDVDFCRNVAKTSIDVFNAFLKSR